MNKLFINTIATAIIGFAATNANAAYQVYNNEEATLTCTTPAICGTYNAEKEITVYREGTEMRLHWGQNVPTGEDAGIFLAKTIATSCPSGSAQTHLTAQWTLDFNGRPWTAAVTHCDGVTISEYAITVAKPPLGNCLFGRNCPM